MGMSFEQSMTFIAALAQGGVRGSAAGYAGKRLLSKQAAPARKLQQVEDSLAARGFNVSMWDGGNPQDFYKFIENVGNAEQHMSEQSSAYVNQQLSGLYAISQFDQLVNFVHKNGGAKGMEAYGKTLTQPGALDRAYAKRTHDNVKVQATKAESAIQSAALEALVAATPDIITLFHWIAKLAIGFDHLSPSVKRFTVDFAGMGTIVSLGLGGAAILLGNFIKFGGVMMEVLGIGARVIAWLGGFAQGVGLADAAAAVFSGALDIVGGALTAVAGFISLPVVAIAALVAAIGTGVVAWVKDWGGIREKTAAVIHWIVQEVPKIPEQLGYMVGRAGVFLAEWTAKWNDFWAHFPETAYNGIKFVLVYLGENVPKWADAGWKAISAWGNAILKALPGIGKSIMGGIENLLNLENPVTWVKAGLGFAHNFTKGLVKGIQDGKPQVKNAQQQVRDLFPGSEPKDSSSPMSGMSKSGQSFSNMFLNGIIDSLRAGKGSVKKAAKPIADVFVDLRGESVAEVIKTTKAIEDALAYQGAVIKNKWMDLMSGGHVTRFYGDPTAVHKAIAQDKGPDPLRGATDYLKRLGEYPQTYQQIMARLHTWLRAANAAELQHEVSMIDALITHVQKAHDAALAKLSLPFTGHNGVSGLFGQINRTFTSEGDKGNSFDALQQKDDANLQRMIEMRKNQELPTIAELNKELTLEINERDTLQKIYAKEIEQRAILIAEIKDTLKKAAAINASDKQSQALKATLLAQAKAFTGQLDTLNGRLEDQQIVITKLNKSIGEYASQIKTATDVSAQWASILSGAFTQAGNDALKALGDSLSNGLDQMLSRVFGAKRRGIAGIAGSFLAEVFSNIFNTLIGSAEKQMSAQLMGTVTSFFGRLFSAGSTAAPSAAPSNPLQDALNAIGTIPGAPQQVQLTDSTGNDLSIPIAQGIQKTAQGVSAVADATSTVADATKAQAGGSQSTSDPMQKFLNSNVGKSLKGIAGAYAGYEMATAPGANDVTKMMGALSTYSSISSMPGGSTPEGQGVAVAAALFTLFSHSDNPSQMPDKYDTQQYGTTIANLLGSGFNGLNPMHANGQSFTEDPTLNQQLGGKGELAYISAWIQANPTEAVKLLGQATVTMLSGATSITGGKNGNLTLNNGQTVNWQSLASAAQNATNAILQLGNNALSASQNAARLAASFVSLILGGPAGFSMPLLLGSGGLGGTVGGGTLPGGGLGNGPHPPPLPLPHPPIHVHILQGATITQDIADQVQSLLPQISSTLAAVVNRANYQQQRLYGDYVSAVS